MDTDPGSFRDHDRLPVYDAKNDFSEEDIRNQIITHYRGSAQEKIKRSLNEGNVLLKTRALEKKYLERVIEGKRQKLIQDELFEHIHAKGLAKARLDHAKYQKKIKKKILKSQARHEIEKGELERQHNAKLKAIQIIEKLKYKRKGFFLLGTTLLLIGILLLLYIPLLKRNQSADFRRRMIELTLFYPKNLADFLPCSGIYGLSPLFFQNDASTFPQQMCEKTIEDLQSEENRTFVEYFLYNITNPEQVLRGAAVVTEEIGPFKFVLGRVRKEAKFTKEKADDSPAEWLTLHEMDYYRYVGSEDLLDLSITTPNLGFQRTNQLLQEWGSDDGLFISLLAQNSLLLAAAEINDTLSYSQMDALDVEDHNIWAGTGFWHVNKTNCPCFAFDYRKRFGSDSGCSWTLGCFIYQENYQRIVDSGLSFTEHTSDTLEKFPVFGNEPLTATQSEMLWNAIKPGLSLDGCVLSNQTTCQMLLNNGKGQIDISSINLKSLVDAFNILWRRAAELPVLSGSAAIKYDVGISQNSLEVFYDQVIAENSRCKVETLHLGSLTCTQLNDIMQYFHRLYMFRWNILYQNRGAEKEFFTVRPARELLQTGYDEASLASLVFGPNNGKMDTSSSYNNNVSLLARLISKPYMEISDIDANWLSNAWVRPIIEIPSFLQFQNLLNRSQYRNGSLGIFPSVFVESKETSQENLIKSIPFSFTTKTYSTGFNFPHGIGYAKYLGKIGSDKYITIFGENSHLEGFDGFTVGPSFDFDLSHLQYNQEGFLNSNIDGKNVWPNNYKIYFHAARRPVDYEYSFLVGRHVNGSNINLGDASLIESGISSGLNYFDYMGETIALPLRRFTITNGLYTKYNSDKGSASCLLNVAALHDNLPVYLGQPRYFGCDSILGDDGNENEYDINNGFTGQVVNNGVVDNPLPSLERATILPVPSIFSNYIDIEPVTGQSFNTEISYSLYLELSRTSYLYRMLPQNVKVPLYSKRLARHRDTIEVFELADVLARIRLRRTMVLVMSSLLSVFSFVAGLYLIFRSFRYEEVRSAAIKPLNVLEGMVSTKTDELIKPLENRVRMCKQEYDSAVMSYDNERKRLNKSSALNRRNEDAVRSTILAGGKPDIKAITREGELFTFEEKALEKYFLCDEGFAKIIS